MTDHVESKPFFGARASIAIRYDGTLEQLAEKLEKSLNLKSFEIGSDSEPPHKLIGMAEAMGWEMWLEEVTDDSLHNFYLSMETEFVSALLQHNIYDLSPWFARLIEIACDVKALPAIRSTIYERKKGGHREFSGWRPTDLRPES